MDICIYIYYIVIYIKVNDHISSFLSSTFLIIWGFPTTGVTNPQVLWWRSSWVDHSTKRSMKLWEMSQKWWVFFWWILPRTHHDDWNAINPSSSYEIWLILQPKGDPGEMHRIYSSDHRGLIWGVLHWKLAARSWSFGASKAILIHGQVSYPKSQDQTTQRSVWKWAIPHFIHWAFQYIYAPMFNDYAMDSWWIFPWLQVTPAGGS